MHFFEHCDVRKGIPRSNDGPRDDDSNISMGACALPSVIFSFVQRVFSEGGVSSCYYLSGGRGFNVSTSTNTYPQIVQVPTVVVTVRAKNVTLRKILRHFWPYRTRSF